MDEQRKFTEDLEKEDDTIGAASEELLADGGAPEASTGEQEALSRATGVYDLPVHDDPAGFSDEDLIKDAAADRSLMDDTREWEAVEEAVRRQEGPEPDTGEMSEPDAERGEGDEPTAGDDEQDESDTPAEEDKPPDSDAGSDESEAPADESAAEETEEPEAADEPEDAPDEDETAQTGEEADIPYHISYIHIDRKPKKRRKKHPLARLFLFTAIVVVAVAFLTSGFFDIKNIEVTGNRYFTDSEIISMADAAKGGNIFRLAQRSSIKRRLLENPYFTGVRVKRKLPSTEVIDVDERRQVAAVPYGDQYVVIDSQGVVLRKTSVDPEVTLLKGMTISRMEVGKKIEVEESDILKSTLKMLSSMRKGDFYFKQINVSKFHIEAYITDMLVVKGSPDKVQAAIESGGLQKVVNKLFKKKIKRGTIDISRKNYISSSPEV